MKKNGKLALIAFVTIALCLLSALLTVKADAYITTDKADYYPSETVTVTGVGFASGESYAVVVIRPDSTVVVGDGSFAPGYDNVTADDGGGFTYLYKLDGVLGTYEVLVYPSSWMGDLTETAVASVTFTDTPPPPQADLKITNFTSTANYTETFPWTIDKSVTPDTWNIFGGDTGTSNYTVTLTKLAGVYHAWIYGSISVNNTGDDDTMNLAIVVNVTDGVPPPNDLVSTVSVDVSSNSVLNPDETGTYSYSIDVPNANVHTGINAVYKVNAYATAVGTKSNDSDVNSLTDPFGTLTLVNDVVHVTDTNVVGSWTFSASGSQSYLKTFTEDDNDTGPVVNTATITETGQYDSASVTVNVYSLDVEKTLSTSFTRTYNWSIDKSADADELHLGVGETAVVNYTVVVDSTGPADSDCAVMGNITITNPAPIDAVITNITDVVSPDIAANITDNPTFPYTLEAGKNLTVHYTADLPDASSRANFAMAMRQAYDYYYNGTAIESLLSSGYGTYVPFDFTGATITEVDKEVNVTDTYTGLLGSLTYGVDSLPATFKYSRTIGPYGAIGTYYVDNTASVKSDDTTIVSDDWEVTVYVEGSEFVEVTSKGFQPIDTFKLIFTPDVPMYPTYSRLTASNPGQFSFNVFCDAQTGNEEFDISIPFPFVTQGANPVHIYTGVSGHAPAGTDITSQFTIDGIPVTLSSYTGTGTFGDTASITITNTGYTGPLYITIHLDYGLKKIAGGYSKDTSNNAKANTGKSTYGSIFDNQEYTFSVSSLFSDDDIINNLNVFKNDPGIGGLVLDSYGYPIVNAKVQIYQGKTLYGTAYTDADGWYMCNFKYTGKPTSFTVKTSGFADQTVTLKANGFLVINFGVA
jgi:hypothetical protein